MRYGIVGVLVSCVFLAGCGDNSSNANGGSDAEIASADQKQSPGLEPNIPCIRELFDKEFCLGGPIDRLSEKRSIPLVGEFYEAPYTVYRYVRAGPLGIQEETIARVQSDRITRMSRVWRGPRRAINALSDKVRTSWWTELGKPEIQQQGQTTYRWSPDGYDVVITLDNGQNEPFGTDALLIEVTVK